MYKIVDFGLRYESKKNDKMKYFFFRESSLRYVVTFYLFSDKVVYTSKS